MSKTENVQPTKKMLVLVLLDSLVRKAVRRLGQKIKIEWLGTDQS